MRDLFFKLINVSFKYQKKTVLEDINIALDGRCTAVMGKNGSGKTTLGKLCCGLLKPSHGRVD